MPAITRLKLLKDLHSNAFTFQRGIEREALRVSKAGQISQVGHPESLGSALTHKSITTDYSESLMEFITGVHSDKGRLLNELDALHRFSFSHLDDEWLWSGSMTSLSPALPSLSPDLPSASSRRRVVCVVTSRLTTRIASR